MTMKTEVIPANVLKSNPNYLRVRVKDDHVLSMYDLLQASKEFPFPPIHVMPIPATDKEATKQGLKYYIIDGHHRAAASLKHGTPVDAIVHAGLSDRDAIAMQVRTNASNGLAFNHADRVRAVKALAGDRKDRGLQAEICKLTGLPSYTVSRILSEKTPPVAGTEADKRTTAGKGKGKSGPVFSTAKWLEKFFKVMAEWEKHGRKIRKTKGFPDGMDSHLDSILDMIDKATAKAEKE